MTQHVLFTDEPEYSVPTAKHADEVADESILDTTRPKQSKTLKWLGLLFWATVVLLIFQVALGFAAGAITLLADSAHAAADALSYGLNFFVEWLKVRADRNGSKDENGMFAGSNAVKIVDTWGSFASLLTLVFAAVFATVEALERLSESPNEESGTIGLALLFFSIVSTAANASLVVMYRHWHSDDSPKPVSTESPSPQAEEEQLVILGNVAPPPPAPVVDLPVPDAVILPIPDAVPELPDSIPSFAPSRKPRPARGQKGPRQGSLNLCRDFNGVEVPKDGESLSGAEKCTRSCCDPVKTPAEGIELGQSAGGLTQTADASASRQNAGGGVMATLHMALHPGCTCSDHGGGQDETVLTSTETPREVKAKNLNVVAAMLHLVTDVLRGILILIVALLIQLGGVKDAEHADATCALIVAFLIAVGSVALLVKVVARIHGSCLRKGYFPAMDEASEAPSASHV